MGVHFIHLDCECCNKQLPAYTYDEQEGAKGGNNVTSLLYKDVMKEVPKLHGVTEVSV